MSIPTYHVVLPVLLLALLGGCASRATTASDTAKAADCKALLAQIEQSEQDKRAATQSKQNAWKAVVPFVVAARYASSQSQLGEADARIEKLEAEFKRRGCQSLHS